MTTEAKTLAQELPQLEQARLEWEAKHVQVLIDDDDVPEGAAVLPLETLIDFLEQQEFPTKVIIAGEYYKIKLRKRVPYREYRKFMDVLNGFVRAEWDKEERVIKIRRWRME